MRGNVLQEEGDLEEKKGLEVLLTGLEVTPPPHGELIARFRNLAGYLFSSESASILCLILS